MTVFTALGAHIVDVLGRPVAEIPPGQGAALLTEIRITVAGAAGGTAVDLARLGGTVRSIGAVGDDNLGVFLLAQLTEAGVDVARMVVLSQTQTSATILPIRANGERPALHVPGVTGLLTTEHVQAAHLAGSDYIHIGGPDVLGEFSLKVLPELLRQARVAGAVTSADLLTTGWPEALELLSPLFAEIDHLLINAEQAVVLTAETDLPNAAHTLAECGPQVVVVTTGAEGGVLVDDQGVYAFPALEVDVVDTTGCGDGFSAGYLRALSLGWGPRQACGLGTACASMVAETLGSDGISDLASALERLSRSTQFPDTQAIAARQVLPEGR